MLHWALSFAVLAVVTLLFGVTGLATTTVETSQVLFWLFLATVCAALLFRFAEGAATPR